MPPLIELTIFGTALLILFGSSCKQFYRRSIGLTRWHPVNLLIFAAFATTLLAIALFLTMPAILPLVPFQWFHWEVHQKLEAGCLAMLVLRHILWQSPGKFVAAQTVELGRAAQIIRDQEFSGAGLALMGDKCFLFSESRRTFLMYAKHGRTWIALQDPVGPQDEWAELITTFIEKAHEHSGRVGFYQVRADSLPLYLDAGLTLMKVGEDAHIDLVDFTIDGPRKSHLRYALRRGHRDSLSFDVISPKIVAAELPILRRISDAWLTHRKMREKSFSVAAFDENFLSSQSAIVVRHAGKPIAFATFMTTDLGVEVTVGVMRHTPNAPSYTMEYLFTQLALHLKDAGVLRMSMGVAPFSEMGCTPMASSWHCLGRIVWRFGERFYNFKGLRAFKNKFSPKWEPRYLAASGSTGIFTILMTLALVTRGKRS